jgi:peptidoglycan/LPS O-acetylase OafA/YrhL
VWGEDERSSARIPALDGLRGLAVLGVLLFHGEISGFGGGFLGVSIFFTLSGFLITSLLLVERDKKRRISLGKFWGRRARRILPAALIALAGVAIFGLTVADAHQAERLPADGLSALTEVANWRFVLGDQSYAALFSAPSPAQHFWSLAIEEQFYLIFPLIVTVLLFAASGRRKVLTIAVVTLAVLSAGLAALLYSPGHDPSRVYYGTDTRAVELLIGALLALLLTGRRRLETRSVRIGVAAVGTAALVGLFAAWTTVEQSDGVLYRGGLAVHALLVAAVITAALVPGPVRTALASPPFIALGLISYGVYLYHWPIFLWLTPERTGLDGYALFGERLALTIAVATVSFLWIERPIRYGTFHARWKPLLAATAGAAAVAALFVSVPSSSAAPKIVFSAVQKPTAALAGAGAGTATAGAATLPNTGPEPADQALTVARTADAAAPPPVRRILLVGDSVAQTLGRGLERWGYDNGVSVVNAGRYYCGIARGGRLAMAMGNTANPCEDWPQRWPGMLDRLRPDVVVVLTTIWDTSPRQRDDWGPDYIGVGDARFDQLVTTDWKAAVDVLGSRGARVVWLTSPCSAQPPIDHNLQYANQLYLASVRRSTPMVQVDLDSRVCPDGKFSNQLGPVAEGRPDGMHFSDAGADWVASWLGPKLANPYLQSEIPSLVRVRRS